jgi:hypothetical protein
LRCLGGSGILRTTPGDKEHLFMVRIAPLLLAAGLAGCAVPVQGPTRGEADPAICVMMYRTFDQLQTSFPNPRPQSRIAAPQVMAQADRLRRAGCITSDADLAGADALPVVPVGENGPPITPIALHAGVVQSMEQDARMRDFFTARDVPVRTVGHGALGRRVYLGPFTTEGGLEDASALAREAGFLAPYPARF